MSLQPFRSVIFAQSAFAGPVFTGSRIPGDPRAFSGAVAATAERIRAAGARRGLLLAAESGAFLTGLLALFRAGAEVVLPPNLRPGTLAELSDSFDCVLADAPVPGAACIEIAETGTPTAEPPIDLDALAITFCTSGSQGAPKRVRKTAGMLEREAIAIETAWGERAKDAPAVAMVPHYHMYGMTFKLVWPLLAGRPFAAAMYEFWEDVLAVLEPRAFLVTGPAHLERLTGIPPIDPARRPAVVLSAGGPVSDSAAEATRRVFGTHLTEVFGSTEGGAIAWRERLQGQPAWTAFPTVTIGEVGGYLSIDSPYSAQARTEDRIERIDERRFVFLGRGDRVVKIEGKRVNLSEIESRLAAHPWIDDAATLVLSRGRRTQLGAAVAPSAEGRAFLSNASVFRFGAHLRRDLERFIDASTLPRAWKVVDALPTDSLGKRSSDLLAALFDDGDAEAPREPVVRNEHTSGSRIELTLWLPETLAWFDGHFPGYPVLPGVVQLQWAIAYGQRCFELGAASPRHLRVKFRQIIVPRSEVRLVLDCDRAQRRMSFSYRGERGEHSSGSWRF